MVCGNFAPDVTLSTSRNRGGILMRGGAPEHTMTGRVRECIPEDGSAITIEAISVQTGFPIGEVREILDQLTSQGDVRYVQAVRSSSGR